jgi:hypothetical protein
MSGHMLSDSNTINDYNPFVVGEMNLPGAWSADWPYSKHKVPVEEIIDKEEGSPICDWGVTAAIGSFLRGGSFCGLGKDNAVSCPMSRNLVPEQLTDPGIWTYQSHGGQKSIEQSVPLWGFVLIFALIAYSAMRLRTL